MNEAIEYLKKKYPDALVWKSLDKDYICVRHAGKSSKFYITTYANGKEVNTPFDVPITDTQHLHVDTVKLEMLNVQYPNGYVTGINMEVLMNKCETCKGHGWVGGECNQESATCPICDGTGDVLPK